VRDAGIDGLGVAILPDHVCRDALEAGRLVHVLPAWRGVQGIARLAFTTRRDLPSTVRALIHHLRAGFPQDVSDKGREAVTLGADAPVYFFRSATVRLLAAFSPTLYEKMFCAVIARDYSKPVISLIEPREDSGHNSLTKSRRGGVRCRTNNRVAV